MVTLKYSGRDPFQERVENLPSNKVLELRVGPNNTFQARGKYRMNVKDVSNKVPIGAIVLDDIPLAGIFREGLEPLEAGLRLLRDSGYLTKKRYDAARRNAQSKYEERASWVLPSAQKAFGTKSPTGKATRAKATRAKSPTKATRAKATRAKATRAKSPAKATRAKSPAKATRAKATKTTRAKATRTKSQAQRELSLAQIYSLERGERDPYMLELIKRQTGQVELINDFFGIPTDTDYSFVVETEVLTEVYNGLGPKQYMLVNKGAPDIPTVQRVIVADKDQIPDDFFISNVFKLASPYTVSGINAVWDTYWHINRSESDQKRHGTWPKGQKLSFAFTFDRDDRFLTEIRLAKAYAPPGVNDEDLQILHQAGKIKGPLRFYRGYETIPGPPGKYRASLNLQDLMITEFDAMADHVSRNLVEMGFVAEDKQKECKAAFEEIYPQIDRRGFQINREAKAVLYPGYNRDMRITELENTDGIAWITLW